MRLNKMIALATLLLALCLTIGVAAAAENTTIDVGINVDNNLMDYDDDYGDYDDYYDDDYEDDYDDEDYDDGEEYNAVIVDTTEFTSDSDDEHILNYEDQYITFKVMDDDGYDADAYSCMEDEYGNDYKVYWDNDKEHYWVEDKLPVGKHEITIFVDDYYYTAEPLTYTVYVEKSYFYGEVICKSYYGTDKTSLTMKATVKDSYGYRENGKVTFKVNGKSYTVKTKNGVATKTIKIKKAGTYTYTATFKSGNYMDTGTGKAKLHVYSTSKNARTFNVKGYKIVVPVSKYNKLLNAKNTNKLMIFEFKTNKYVKQKVGHNKNNLKTVKARVSMLISYGGKNGGQYGIPNKYYLCLNTPYQNPGYDYCTPWLSGAKKSSEINKLNSAKTINW